MDRYKQHTIEVVVDRLIVRHAAAVDQGAEEASADEAAEDESNLRFVAERRSLYDVRPLESLDAPDEPEQASPAPRRTGAKRDTSFRQRVADSVARFGGSWAFIILFAVLLAVYTAINVILDRKAWDPYPFILLNLFLSMLAAVQAPVIMMSQNRQDAKDRLRGELDFDVNRRAEFEIQGLAQRLNVLDDKLDDLGKLLHQRGVQ